MSQARAAAAPVTRPGPRLLGKVYQQLRLRPRNEHARTHGKRGLPPVRHVAQVLERRPEEDKCKKRRTQPLHAPQPLLGRSALLGAHLPCSRLRQSSPRSWSCRRSGILQPSARPAEQRFTSRHALQRCAPGPQQAPTASSSSQSSSFCKQQRLTFAHSNVPCCCGAAPAPTRGECSHQELLCCRPAVLCKRIPGFARLCCRPVAPLQQRCHLRRAHGLPLAHRQADCCSGQAAGGQHALLQQRRQATSLVEHHGSASTSVWVRFTATGMTTLQAEVAAHP